ncbi:hypothetical protein J918_0177 [Acinetobacter baumannii 25493_5]|nr:hypothetical protein J918_0177 [Acinetobacter baumannii 25493_5]EYS36119.1 hypothetical protein K042_0452 [Acinetobacter baumannii 45052_3]KCW08500.1 hypothetical protein J988_2682 [Acinetobacter baumannii 45075_2]KCZ24758.1 hypothetical protein K041_0081 [Acinetobacter baumannii 45052_2]
MNQLSATDCRASLQQVAYFKVSIYGLQNCFLLPVILDTDISPLTLHTWP